MKNRSKSTKFVWLAMLFTTLLGLGIWRLHRPAPNWYVSPPLDTQGRRVQGPIPYGWRLDTQDSHLPTGVPKPDERVTIVFESQEPMLSRCLRLIHRQPAPQPSRLYVDVGRNLEMLGYNPKIPADGKENIGAFFSLKPNFADRVIKAGQPPLYMVIAFLSEDKQTFDSNHGSINRFRIE